MPNGRVMEKIINTYMKLRNISDVSLLDRFNVVIIMQPKILCELMNELHGDVIEDRNLECYFIILAGQKTPIIIDNKLHEQIEFQIMTQSEYERIEQEKFFTKLNSMFYK